MLDGMSIIELNNVSYAYNAGTDNEVRALRGLTLSIDAGEFVALVGHNGSGKSTVARLMNGLIAPTGGTVTVDGMSTADSKQLFDIRKTVGVVFQNPDNQMIATIIEDDVAFGPENLGLKPAEIAERVDWALTCVGMQDSAKGTPFRLSGGQKQRIAIAGVLAIKPRVIVMDESTAMLDPIGRAEVMQVIKKLNREQKMTVIMITHFMEEAADADRIVVLSGGEIAADGGKEIFLRDEMLCGAGLDVPLVTRLAARLSDAGVEVTCGEVSAERLVDELCR